MSSRQYHHRAFTLIELLLTVSIIGILATITIGVMSPRRQLSGSRDVKRQADVNAVMSAIDQYSIDHGDLPVGIPKGIPKEICAPAFPHCTGGVDLLMLSGAYIITIPMDPRAPADGTGSQYFIVESSNGRLITITAPLAEGNHAISITR